MPPNRESWKIPAAITTAAVIGACRHIVFILTTKEEIKTVTASAIGNIQSCAFPTNRKTNPIAHPTSTFDNLALNILFASSGCGSEAATIDAIAQIGFLSPINFKVYQHIAVEIATLIANLIPIR